MTCFDIDILVESGLSELKTEVDEHFHTNILKTAAVYQVVGKEVDKVNVNTINANEDFDFEGFAEQVLFGIKDIPPAKV